MKNKQQEMIQLTVGSDWEADSNLYFQKLRKNGDASRFLKGHEITRLMINGFCGYIDGVEVELVPKPKPAPKMVVKKVARKGRKRA